MRGLRVVEVAGATGVVVGRRKSRQTRGTMSNEALEGIWGNKE